MKFTGERFIPTEQGKIRLEHYHRYVLVQPMVAGKDVLDVACGEGYGASFMADVARSVIGVDISDEAVEHALSTYKNVNLTFRQGDATKLDFVDASFDVVVSFETIEHLLEQAQMLSEIRRVLRPDGILVISSPNRPIYSEESGEHNQFHVKELDFNEFDELLIAQFPAIKYVGQRMLMGSVIQPLEGGQSAFRAWHDDGNNLQPNAGHLAEPVYFVAICAASNSSLPRIDMSVLYPEKLDLVKYYVGFARWAQTLDQTVSERDELIVSLKAEVKYIRDSKSWRYTRPLREVYRWILLLKQRAQQYLKDVVFFFKKNQHRLPLSYQTKRAIYRRICMYLPSLSGLQAGTPTKVVSEYGICSNADLISENTQLTELLEKLNDKAKGIATIVSEAPIVSVIIPVYGELAYTVRCLNSILNNKPAAPFELIVIDDQSTDETFSVLSDIAGIRLLQNKENSGFIRSCNTGVKFANGDYLYFLNNDTEVTPGWMDELLRTFNEFPGTGLVGSKLIYPDGHLQEAGGIIWQDGSAWNFGHMQDPLLPVYNYAREVDYCSGASIMVPKALFDELGGFDEHYLPAYCEDSDLALKIRDKGYRVIYQPLSIVIHYEGVTSGTDTTQGAKAYQVENSKKLFDRWQHRLQTHQAPGVDADNAKDRCASRRALVVDHCTPTPNQDAGSVTVFNLLLLLREMGFQVTFIPEDNFLYMPEHTTALQRIGIEVLYSPYATNVEQHLKEFGYRYDLAFLFRPGVVQRQIKTIRKHCPNAKVLFHTVDLHFLRMSREAELQSDKAKQKAADEMKERELAAIRASDAAIVHSTTELELLRPLLPDSRLHVFPLIMDIKGTNKTFAERRDIVFVGGYQHTPNIDAVHYFATEIMPLLRKQLPGACFYAVGSRPPASVLALASEDIIITGFVEDLTSLLDKMRVSVAPLRYGAGIKGKIGTAMAVGLPVVATSLATEGMSLSDDENILEADGSEAFANAIVKIYQDETLWMRISQNGLQFADKAWGAEAAWLILAEIVADLGMDVTRGEYPLSLYSEPREPETETKNGTILEPIVTVNNRKEYEQFLQSDLANQIRNVENRLLNTANSEAFTVDGFCVPCDQKVSFLVDMQSGGQRLDDGWIPNWRERLECPLCGMNNRQRLIATLLKQVLFAKQGQHVYFMEQVTPIYNWAKDSFNEHYLVGSEYLGYQYEGGATIKGIRHEDVENLSFSNAELDLIVSNDVFEHVPHPAKAFEECARVLKGGGVLLATIPFHSASDISEMRARLSNGQVEHILPQAYHGNPVSADGSLVFTDFGWDMLELMTVAGFSSVNVEVYASAEFGHLGGGQIVFRAEK